MFFFSKVCTFTVHDRFATISSTDEERARIRPCKHCILGQAPHIASSALRQPRNALRGSPRLRPVLPENSYRTQSSRQPFIMMMQATDFWKLYYLSKVW